FSFAVGRGAVSVKECDPGKCLWLHRIHAGAASQNTCHARYPQVTSRPCANPGFPVKNIIGSICALATPFRAEALDLAAFGVLIDYQLAAGTQGLVVAGSTGEAHALDQAEYDRLLAFAVERVAGRVPVLAGTGGANTNKT